MASHALVPLQQMSRVSPTSKICSKSVELETKEALLESSEPSAALPLMALVVDAAEEEEAVELPLRNFDPEMKG